jgi:hypothetical protein
MKAKFNFIVILLLSVSLFISCKKTGYNEPDINQLKVENQSVSKINSTFEEDETSAQRIDSYVGTITTVGSIKTLALKYIGPRSTDYYGEMKTTETAVGSDGKTYQFACTHLFSSKYNGRHSPKFEWTIVSNFGVLNGGVLQPLPFTFQLLPATSNEVYFIQNQNYPTVSCNETQLTYPLYSLNSGSGIIPPYLIAQRGGQTEGTSIPMYINGDIWSACNGIWGSIHAFNKVRFEKLAVRAVHANAIITIEF